MVRRILPLLGILLAVGLLGSTMLSAAGEGETRDFVAGVHLPEEDASANVNRERPPVKPAGDILPLPEDLPTAPANADDLDGAGGYLLLGQVPEADIALYCDNDQVRSRVYIRYGTHFQAFDQEAWMDPTILPEVSWTDWDGDGKEDLVVDYLRHQGTYFDGTTTSPGIVGERVVYQWDGNLWTDIHFFSGGGLQQG